MRVCAVIALMPSHCCHIWSSSGTHCWDVSWRMELNNLQIYICKVTAAGVQREKRHL